ncbi:hypothetical protein E0W68_09120 [Flavobacterium salilacus subsp. salilacus]|uniref:DUF6526 family protein n=1 Tax=Flavobacterium TaxID=237 RepID=UPI001074C075|nr:MULTISPECIES: DUF6526 family protein [Flavobacterium]KAF2518476.1 hypothetical protein E0W68_09120 [Flavobacterium salilacus subsp. salilacus]MBE1615115.1 hypothetical protein [Flavobacterium sp. SaA2.13]
MSQKQNYKNHIRFYPPHHFVFYPLMLILLAATAYYASKSEEYKQLWLFMGMLTVAVIWLSFMLRQHYALTLQNRLVMLEMRYRYFVLTGKRLELLEDKLSQGQIFALRFAPDEELVILIDKAVNENLSPNAIKKSIKNWRADNRRV